MVMVNLDHLHYTARTIAMQDNDKRIQYIQSSHWIGYSRAIGAIAKLESLYHFPQRQRMPNLLIVGATNNGKTMIVEKFCRLHMPMKKESETYGKYGNFDEAPIVAIQMPSHPDIKRFYSIILHQLGIPSSANVRIGVLEDNVLHYLKLLKVKMLIIDEIHNILVGRSDQQREFLNLLRFLGNELRIPLVCVGTKEAYIAIRSDDQLENRFEPFPIPLWEAGEEYHSLLASFATLLPLRKSSNLNGPAIAQRILSLSEGTIGEIATLITRAAIQAIQFGQEEIDDYCIRNIDYLSPTARRKVFEQTLK
jgi:hypothetical protein